MRQFHVTERKLWYEARRSRQKSVQTSQVVETALEAGCADDMPGVYKLPMVRMSMMTDEIPNVRV